MTMSLVAEPVPRQYFIQYERPSSIPLRLGTQRDRQTIPTRTTSLTLESSQSNLRQPSTLNPQLLLLFGVVWCCRCCHCCRCCRYRYCCSFLVDRVTCYRISCIASAATRSRKKKHTGILTIIFQYSTVLYCIVPGAVVTCHSWYRNTWRIIVVVFVVRPLQQHSQ